MDFEKIKDKMNSDTMEDYQIPEKIKDFKTSKMPIQKVRKNMRIEIITQLLIIVGFFMAPRLLNLRGKEMYETPLSVYYITIFITSLITIGYLVKMSFFLTKTNGIEGNSKEIILKYIHDLKLTLEVYKTAIISGSLLLIVSLFSFCTGIKGAKLFNENAIDIFNNIFSLNLSTQNMIFYTLIFLGLWVVIYFGTVLWTNRLYGTHIKNLENTLKEFDIK